MTKHSSLPILITWQPIYFFLKKRIKSWALIVEKKCLKFIIHRFVDQEKQIYPPRKQGLNSLRTCSRYNTSASYSQREVYEPPGVSRPFQEVHKAKTFPQVIPKGYLYMLFVLSQIYNNIFKLRYFKCSNITNYNFEYFILK